RYRWHERPGPSARGLTAGKDGVKSRLRGWALLSETRRWREGDSNRRSPAYDGARALAACDATDGLWRGAVGHRRHLCGPRSRGMGDGEQRRAIVATVGGTKKSRC